MQQVIGVFDTQEQAIEAVEGLEREGFRRESLKVLAKDYESSRRIERETDVHVDELNDLVDTREDSGEGPLNSFPGGFIGGAGVSPVIGATGLSTYNASTIFPAGAFAWTAYPGGRELDGALHALGIRGEAAAMCTEALNEGRFVIAAEVGQEAGDYRSAVEQAMRVYGAKEIVRVPAE